MGAKTQKDKTNKTKQKKQKKQKKRKKRKRRKRRRRFRSPRPQTMTNRTGPQMRPCVRRVVFGERARLHHGLHDVNATRCQCAVRRSTAWRLSAPQHSMAASPREGERRMPSSMQGPSE